MPEYVSLEVTQREVLGKKVKQLRRDGKVPVVLYGPGSETMSLTADGRELRQVLLEAGGTQLIELNVGGEKIPTLARDVQRDPLRGDILHVDFYRVSMDRPISADIPIILVGENALVETGAAVLVHSLNTLSIEALPSSLMAMIEVDVGRLTEIGDQLLVRDLSVPGDVTILTDENELVAKLDYPQLAEEEEEEEEEFFLEETAEPELIRGRREEDEEED